MIALSAFPCELRWRGRTSLFIWLSGKQDSVVVDATGAIRLFDSLDAVFHFARSQDLMLGDEEPAMYDFDEVLTWCNDPQPPIDCSRILTAWNMLADVHSSRPRTNDLFGYTDRRHLTLYDKLFLGCNLPSMTPEGQRYDPVWSAEDCRKLAQLLRLGLVELQAALPPRVVPDIQAMPSA